MICFLVVEYGLGWKGELIGLINDVSGLRKEFAT